MRAPTPTRIRCPKCKSRLQTSGRKWPLWLLGVLLGGIIVGPGAIIVFALCVESLGIPTSALLALIAFVSLVVACDLPVSMYVLNKRDLETTAKAKPTTKSTLSDEGAPSSER